VSQSDSPASRAISELRRAPLFDDGADDGGMVATRRTGISHLAGEGPGARLAFNLLFMLIRFTRGMNMHTRTYFVGGHRVEHARDAQGQSSATCDCSEYLDGTPKSGQRWCQHVERITAAEELDHLMLTPALIVSSGRY
jgi:hypothetical protein